MFKKEIYGIAVGSNLGNRLGYIRKGIELLKNFGIEIIEVSKIYETKALLLPDSPADWDINYLNLALKIRTDVLPETLLGYLKVVEAQVGRKPHLRWSPRELDLDILVWNHGEIDLPHLKIPHLELTNRLFALQPLSEIWPNNFLIQQVSIQDWLLRLQAKETLKITPFAVDRPTLLGIINLSPESFSVFYDIETAIKKVETFYQQGCEYVDVGGVSTAPGRKLVDEQVEWERLSPFLTKYPPKSARLSVDTFNLSIMKKLAAYPAVKMINDQSGELTQEKLSLFKQTDWKVVVMDNLGLPAENKCFDGIDIIEKVYDHLVENLNIWVRAGLSTERFIFDPGIGFGKTVAQNLLLLENLQLFKDLGVKVLVGHSRKSFLTKWQGNTQMNADHLTAALSYHLKQVADYLRIHEPLINLKWLARDI